MHWQVSVGSQRGVAAKEFRGSYADYSEWQVVDQDRLPHYIRRTAKMRLAEFVTQHRYCRCTGTIVVGQNQASCGRHHAKSVEIITRNKLSPSAFRLAHNAQTQCHNLPAVGVIS